MDWLLFSQNVVTLGLSTFFTAVVGFGVAGIGTGAIQRIYHGDGLLKSLLKGLLAGITVAIPLPVAGSALGGGILALSGLNRLWDMSTSKKTSSEEEH